MLISSQVSPTCIQTSGTELKIPISSLLAQQLRWPLLHSRK